MSNLAKTAPEITEVQNLLTKLGEFDKTAEGARREELRSAWGHGIFDRNEAINTAKRIRSQIGELTAPKAAPHSQRTGASARVTEDDVPKGHYALRTQAGAANEIAFYNVKWWNGRNGRMFSVYLEVGGHEDSKLAFPQAKSVLDRIAEDTNAAFLLYGKETETCGVCGIQLTKDESRARGMGDICADNRGVI
jgi:inactivated superfamily I helicase